MTNLIPLSPADVAARLNRGALLVDIREADEFARRHVAGAVSRPLSAFEQAHLRIEPGQDVIFTCRTGNRTSVHCARLQASVDGDAWVLEGGVDGWAAAGLPVVADRAAPLELMRQVQIAAGLLVLAGVLLGFTVSPILFGLAAFVGAGLTFAGATGWCGMAILLAQMPWNRRAAA
ncbi:rhodanese-like domain-containing protein [Allosphingosinicella sp.]|uniref:rhodanese-like domain-containing protein n=1 Tax=Allosphingosinicella sp. TaxID=2823234 RepID=UPI003784E5B5